MRAHRFAFAFLFLIATAVFLPALVKQEVFTIRDHLDYFQPLRMFTAEELKGGRLPLWNPYSASGEPWLANPQTGVFYPPAWLFLVLPFETAYMLFLLAHLVILGWGAYLLFARTASQGAAMVGAAAVMFCGPTLSLLDVNNNLATFAWLPLVLWCAAERSWRRGAFALAMAFLGGEPFFAALGALMFAVVSSAAALPPFSHAPEARSARFQSGGRAAALRILLAGATAIGLTAVQLFPFLEAVALSDRAAGMSANLILRDSMPLRDWLRIGIPPTFQSLAFDPSLGQHFITVIYVGMLTVALAIIGLTSIRQRHVAGWAALLGFAIAIGTGPAFLAELPLTLFRYPARLVPLGALAIAGLAVAGWERIRGANRRWLDLLVVLLVVADLVPRSKPLLHTAPFTRGAIPYPPAVGADVKLIRVGAIDPAQRRNWIAGYLNLYDRRFDAHTAAPFESERYQNFFRGVLETPTPENLAFLSGGWILASMPMHNGLEPVARSGAVTVWRNPSVWPMARLVSNDVAVPAAWEMTTTSARIVVDAPKLGTLVLAQQLAPGWRVEVDGVRRTPMLFDGVFRAVEVPKGRHEVVWSYRPWTLFSGAAVTLVTLLFLQFFRLVKRRR